MLCVYTPFIINVIFLILLFLFILVEGTTLVVSWSLFTISVLAYLKLNKVS